MSISTIYYVLHGFYFGVSYNFNVKPYHLLCVIQGQGHGREGAKSKEATGWST